MQPITFGLVLGLVTSIGLNAVFATILIIGLPQPDTVNKSTGIIASSLPAETIAPTYGEENAEAPERQRPNQLISADDELDPRYLKGAKQDTKENRGALEIPPYHKMTVAWYMALNESKRMQFWNEIVSASCELDPILVNPTERKNVTSWLMNCSDAALEIVRLEHEDVQYEQRQLLGDYIPIAIRALKTANIHPSIKQLNANKGYQ